MKRYLRVLFNIPVDREFTYLAPKGAEVGAGYRVAAMLGARRLTGFVVGEAPGPPTGVREIREILRVADSRPSFTEELCKLAGWMSRAYLCSAGEALAAMVPGGRRRAEGCDPDLGAGGDHDLHGRHELTAEQEQAIAGIAGSRGLYYVHGVTGSGKTEVFIRASREVLGRGLGVVYLVPEILLTHQIVERFRGVFGSDVAVLHSGMTPSQRLHEWYRLMDGEARIAVGARSAVFAPIPRIGLIVLDEEHEGSYKSSAAPRYHARQVAMHRAEVHGCPLVMGSATPSVESRYHMESGTLSYSSLPSRTAGGAMPEVRVVDMNRENAPFSRELVAELRAASASGRQSILFLNHRGFAYFFHCRSCGYSVRCRNCSVSLTYHKAQDRLVCHYCGYSQAPISVCPECGSLDVGYSGFGTERIEDDLHGLMPELRVHRLDADAVHHRSELARVLRDFRAGAIDVLLGTQMVAKGLDFPGVGLVGIVLADVGLSLPDFRAEERTFALIMQVSGRAGRTAPGGKVIVQTYRPESEAIRLATSGRQDEFYRRELSVRKELGFPPFVRLIRLVFRGRVRERVVDASGELVGRLREGGCPAEILGPSECPLSFIGGNHRYHVMLRAPRLGPAREHLRRVLAGRRPERGVFLEVDVDPTDLL